MAISPEELAVRAAEIAESRADNAGGHLDPYRGLEGATEVDSSVAVSGDEFSPPAPRSRKTVPADQSKVLRLLVKPPEATVGIPLPKDAILQRISEIREQRDKLKPKEKTPARIGRFAATYPTPQDMADELGVTVVRDKDPFGNIIYRPITKNRRQKKN